MGRPTRADAGPDVGPSTLRNTTDATPPRAHAPRPPRPAQFDGKPFNKGSMAASVIATVAGGAGVICFAAFFQNKKHGFIK